MRGHHNLTATKSPWPQEGKLEVCDLGASTRSYVEDAHEGPVWSMAALPDKTGFVSGSADKSVKFWQWKIVVAADGAKQLRLVYVVGIDKSPTIDPFN